MRDLLNHITDEKEEEKQHFSLTVALIYEAYVRQKTMCTAIFTQGSVFINLDVSIGSA